MHVAIKHSFTKSEAVTRVKAALDQARSQAGQHVQGLEERWEEDTLHFSFNLQGKKIDGTLEVRDQEFDLNAKLPLLWRMFEGKIEKMIEAQASQFIK